MSVFSMLFICTDLVKTLGLMNVSQRRDYFKSIHGLTPRCAEGREFEPRPGQYSRMSFSSDQVTGTVFPHLNMPFLPNSKFI